MSKTIIIWVAAVFITLTAAIYQRLTGPTYPKRVQVSLNNTDYKLKLLRSSETGADAEVKINIPDTSVKAKLYFKRLKTNDEWSVSDFKRTGESLSAFLPQQPSAGKLEYYLEFVAGSQTKEIFKDKPVVIRFKGAVPDWILIPHIFFMFFAMLISNLSGLMAALKHNKQKIYGQITLGLFICGGLILGPIVQKYAFGDFWTGVPFGWDLTDNKTLIAFIGWAFAVAMNFKKERPWATIVATVILLLVYSIPHSMFGSELNYASGQIKQGMISLFQLF